MYYQDDYCYYFRKPAGVPSTFGKEPSFLDFLLASKENTEGSSVVHSLFAFFGKEGELWLLNRLDNETAGLLYFAKYPKVKQQFKLMQSAWKVHKYYLAQVYGDITPFVNENPLPSTEGKTITYPIMHHKYNPDRMVVIKQPTDKHKAKWREHQVETKILEYQFFNQSKTSLLLIEISKGIRHQIRAHLSSIGFPICGDTLYSKVKKADLPLQLFSVGMKVWGEYKRERE